MDARDHDKKPKSKYVKSTKQHKNALWDKQKDVYAWHAGIDYRLHPEQYRVGKGEQGVLICEPYKAEILQYWRFKNPAVARESSERIYRLFLKYLEQDEFVGADMARKYLQMGYTRARRYANHKGGLKYDPVTGQELPQASEDTQKAESASIFYAKWQQAEQYILYKNMKKAWKKQYG